MRVKRRETSHALILVNTASWGQRLRGVNGFVGSDRFAGSGDRRRTKQIRNQSSRDQRAGKTNFAECQAEPVRNHGEKTVASRFRER